MVKKRIVIVLLSINITFTGLSSFLYIEEKRKAISELNSRQMILAKNARDRLESFFADASKNLKKLSISEHIIELDKKGMEDMDHALAFSPGGVRAVTRINEAGKITYTVPYHEKALHKDISGQKHVKRLLKTRRPTVSDVFTCVQGFPTVSLLYPVFSGPEFRGAIAFLINFQSISKAYLKEIRIGETGYAWLTNQNGIELYCPVPGHTGKSVFENCRDFPSILSMARDMLQGKQGVTTYRFNLVRDQRTEEETKHAVYLPIKVMDTVWSLVIATSETDVTANLASMKNKFFVLAGLFLCLNCICLYWYVKAGWIIRTDTIRKRAQKKIYKSEKKYRSLFENSSDIICLHDFEGNILETNFEFKDIYGWKPGEIRRTALRDILPEYHKPLFPEYLNRVTVKGEDQGRFKFYAKTGQKIISEYRSKVIQGTTRAPKEILVTARDITIQYSTEKALRESESKYRNLVRNAPVGIYEFDMERRRFISVNDVMCEYTGYTESEFLMLDPNALICEESKDKLNKVFEHVFKNRPKDICNEYKIKGKRNRIFWVRATTKIFYEDGRPRRTMTVVHDLTDMFKAEEEKRALENRLHQAQKMEAIGNLAGGIAHDFNNILGGIFGFAELAEHNTDKPEKVKKHLRKILGCAHRAKDLVQQILTYSRKTEFEKRPFRMRLVIKEAVKLIRSSIPATIEIQSDLVSRSKIMGDPSKMHQVVVNLCTNAYHAMKEGGGTLKISLDDVDLFQSHPVRDTTIPPGKYMRLIVKDTGKGMDAATRQMAFDPYFTTKQPGEGTGLGLALVKAIVDEHGGFLEINSNVGMGTALFLYFPITNDTEISPTSEPHDNSPKNGEKGATILFADDEEDIRESFKSGLEAHGYQILSVGNGADALAAFESDSESFDLVITDMAMPQKNGVELAAAIRKLNSGIPVILCSGINHAPAFKKSGITSFLSKPVLMQDMLKEIRAVLDSPE